MPRFRLYHNCDLKSEMDLISINKIEDQAKVSHVYKCSYCGKHVTLIIEDKDD